MSCVAGIEPDHQLPLPFLKKHRIGVERWGVTLHVVVVQPGQELGPSCTRECGVDECIYLLIVHTFGWISPRSTRCWNSSAGLTCIPCCISCASF